MKALTLWQPWATLIAHGIKTVETRSWPICAPVDQLAIHAAKRPMTRDDEAWLRRELTDRYSREFADVLARQARMMRGVVVAVCAVEVCLPGPAVLKAMPDQAPWGDFTAGRWAWVLKDITPVDPPVPATGRQGLWDWDPEAVTS